MSPDLECAANNEFRTKYYNKAVDYHLGVISYIDHNGLTQDGYFTVKTDTTPPIIPDNELRFFWESD